MGKSLLERMGLVHVASTDEGLPPDTDADTGVAGDFRPGVLLTDPGSGTGVSAPAKSALEADFPELYARMNAVGDPNTDPLLVAFESFLAMAEKDRGIAMAGMLKATRADAAAVASSLDKRLKVLNFIHQEEEKRAAERRQKRGDELVALEQDTNTRIAEHAQQIEALRAALAARKTEGEHAEASDKGTLQGFELRVRTEIARLKVLFDFLKPLAASDGSKKK